MPPLRTFLPVAPVKTERTHEENQERAYIAASRRSDRSLEARVESARRASEIHKRRTGRSLRVTEQDVLNEEMYEEEDDDLPSQYRRLTAHLQTGSADFNRRLAAYLTNHVAMRSALDQAITASYAQQFPNAPQFAHNDVGSPVGSSVGSFPSPFTGIDPRLDPRGSNRPNAAGPSSAASPTTPTTPHSPHQFRTAPYPMPGSRNYRNNAHHRSASISNEKEAQKRAAETIKSQTATTSKDTQSRRASMQGPKPALSDLKGDAKSSVESSTAESKDKVQENYPTVIGSSIPTGFGPFTTSLPPDTQQLIGPMLDPNDPFTYSLMSGNPGMGLPSQDLNFYNYAPKSVARNLLAGMNSTLAPPASSQEGISLYGDAEATAGNHPPTSHFYSQYEDLKGDSLLNLDNEEAVSAATPGEEGAWDAFINDSWAENAS